MTVKELSQLHMLNREIEMDKKRLDELDAEIRRDKSRLARMESQLNSPSSPKYDGMPKSPSYENKTEVAIAEVMDLRNSLKQKRELYIECTNIISSKQTMCFVERNRLERYIAALPNSLLRMIFTYRFVNGLPWSQVSESIGNGTTEDSVRKMCYRYLDEQNKITESK
ncbi:MAG: hypothetical protein NC177_18355 [Ruminococcus flavefaciens]|nr:hypothetical protein [Ruminococcus flavefaciens]